MDELRKAEVQRVNPGLQRVQARPDRGDDALGAILRGRRVACQDTLRELEKHILTFLIFPLRYIHVQKGSD